MKHRPVTTTTLCLLFVVALLTPGVYTATGPSSKLTHFLQQQHDRSAPPDGVVDVHHEMELVHIITVDELKQVMRVLVYVVQEWTDHSLSWNPGNFSGLTNTWLPVDVIWVPDIIVFNMLDHSELLKDVRAPAVLDYTGKVTFSYPAIYTVMCTIRIKNFPFDDQSCALRIASWGYSEEKLILNASHKSILEHYSCNEEWALKDVGIVKSHYEHEGTTISEVRYIISIERKPLFYIITLVFPSYIICILSVAGLFARFSTRNEREERFTLGVTSILSMAVLSLVVAEKVPHSSEEVPLMVLYFHFTTVIVTLATVTTSTVMRIHGRGTREKHPPSKWIMRALLLRTKTKKGIEEEENLGEEELSNEELWAAVSRRLDYVLATVFLFIITIPTAYMFRKNHLRLQALENGIAVRCAGPS